MVPKDVLSRVRKSRWCSVLSAGRLIQGVREDGFSSSDALSWDRCSSETAEKNCRFQLGILWWLTSVRQFKIFRRKVAGYIFWLLSFLYFFFPFFFLYIKEELLLSVRDCRINPQINVLLCKDNFSKPSSFAPYGNLANALIYNLWWIVAYVLTVFCRQMWANVPTWLEAMCLWLGWGQNQTVKWYPSYGSLMWICCLAVWLRYFQLQVEKADVLLQMEPSFD